MISFTRKRFGSLFIPIIVSLLFPPLLTAGDGPVTLIHMGDIHGHLIPRPHFRRSDPDYGKELGGLAYLYDQIKKIGAVCKSRLAPPNGVGNL